ncbi:MFS family (AraJ) (PDB:4LDS) [Commensalibacter communis]|uniref:DHA2 family efflux MFS transporter permease subunit n=1 Tax=Commensalibacter communis TaxID=2972786 RepID=UPI0022FF6102|nr:DHA2 family efflux MFS transporter permease subunit [Commensalibacter communis]CAI3925429.1 MFS family (AraJ) (PDB:4LDS) [Commensalibacter communis]CAI3925611.1 MFS family (AraJ) (PDB:4LDS) [Commensalibacter communis]CAI3926322.1 MFS family (AraJ) (PDB:4LDS) [Commensalibacter communis]CAI3929319.1 MFS family (AraJ) (PDB:4LDS) [Commensalibacter communis]CAI3929372.1 MFS family (AraJ) (PDB:4LDS) [Commensalibacter communis]
MSEMVVTDDSIDRNSWKPKHNPWLIAVVVTLAAFMEVLDTTIVNVSLPHIAGTLSTTYDNATWSLTSYLAANAVVLTISGWLGRVLGRKRYFLICIGMFTLSSFLCGMASSLGELIIFRLMQGFFGGGLQPNQQSIILDIFPPEKRGAAFGLTAMATVVAPILGPSLGGWITDSYSWRWVFYLNVPIGIITIFAVIMLLEDPPWAKKRKESVDVIGLTLITVGLACLEVMVDRGEDADWFGSTAICWLAFFAVVGIVGAIFWLLKAKDPVVDLRAFKDRNFAVSCILMAGLGGCLYASAIIVPQFSQQIIGYTAFLSGLVLTPGGIVIVILIPLVGRLINFVQIRYVIAFGFFWMGTSMFISAHLTPTLDFNHLVLFRIAQTACLAFLFVPLSTIAFMTIPAKYNADASALFSMVRNVLGALCISGATALVTNMRQINQAHIVHTMSPLNQPFNEYLAHMKAAAQQAGYAAHEQTNVAMSYLYKDFQKQVAILAYNDVFMIIGFCAFAFVPICFLLDGYTARKKKSK